MKKLAALGLVAVALFSQTGCKRLANNRRDAKGGVFGASPLITTTPATTFANDELTFEGLPRARVSFSTTPTDYVVTFWGLPDGVVAKVGTQTLCSITAAAS